MAADLPEEIAEEPKFTTRQQRFIEAYCVSGNCTQAAKEAGYSLEYAYSIGSRLSKNVEIRQAIDERLAAYSISAALATKLNSEIAQSRLNDFFTIRPVQGYELEEHYLSVLAERKREEVAFIVDFAGKNGIGLAGEAGPTEMGKRLAAAQRELLELELEVVAHGPMR